jgi:hypothetical protein
LLHQYQREVKRVNHNGQALEYIEVALSDIEIANQLAHEVLGRTLEELPPQTAKLLKQIKAMVETACQQQDIEQAHYRFSRRDVREACGWGNTQLKVHLRRLEELEYLLIHRGGRGQSIVYELLYDGELDDQKHLMGLIDVEQLGAAPAHPCARGTSTSCTSYDAKKSGVKPNRSGSSRPQAGAKSPPGRGVKKGDNPQADNELEDGEREADKNASIRPKNNRQSYRNHAPAMSAKGR